MIDGRGYHIHHMPANDLVAVTLGQGGERQWREPGRVVGMVKLVANYGEERVIPAKRAWRRNHEDSVISKSRFHRCQHRSGVVQMLDDVASDDHLKRSRTVQVLRIFGIVANDSKTQPTHLFYHWLIEIKANHFPGSLMDSFVQQSPLLPYFLEFGRVATSQIENFLIAAVVRDKPGPIYARAMWQKVIELEVFLVHVILPGEPAW